MPSVINRMILPFVEVAGLTLKIMNVVFEVKCKLLRNIRHSVSYNVLHSFDRCATLSDLVFSLAGACFLDLL